MTVVADDYVLRHAPGPQVDVHPSIVRARAALRTAMALLHGVSDADMEFVWDWDGQEADVRYGFYRLFELLELAAAAAERAVGAAGAGRARQPIAAATAARWDLHGVLAGLRDDDLDADPGGGEWTVRQTLQHIFESQRGYAWQTAWWIGQRDAAANDFPARWPVEERDAADAASAGDTDASLPEIGARFDLLMDAGAARLALLTPDELAARGRWSGLPVTVEFRQWRWSSHIREHTIQLEKTLTMLRRDPTEVERLLRLIAAAYGRLEARVFAVDPGALESAAGGDKRAAAAILDDFAATVERYGQSVPAAAVARVPYVE